MPERKSPEKSATLYKVGTKKIGNDGNTWIIEENKNGVKRWVLFKRSFKKNSKQSSKKVSKRISKKISNQKTFSNFNSFDFSVYDKIKEYKSIYEIIMHKSLEYKIDLQENNVTQDVTNINYSPITSDATKINKQKIYKTKMFVIGYLDKNTFKWNEKARVYYLNYFFKNTFELLVKNKKIVESVKKLFSHNSITLPEKYRQVIIYLLSLFGVPHLENYIRFNMNDVLLFIKIDMPLDIPYWEKSTHHIINDLNDMKGGSVIKKTNLKNYLTRTLKDNIKGHKTEIKKLIFQ